MVVSFSSGYYVDCLYVEPHNGGTTLLNAEQVATLNEEIYAEPNDVIFRTDLPLVVKVGTTHYVAYPCASVPFGSLQVPHEAVPDKQSIPGHLTVLIAKKHRVEQLGRFVRPHDEELH
jgi:hypothetical protein